MHWEDDLPLLGIQDSGDIYSEQAYFRAHWTRTYLSFHLFLFIHLFKQYGDVAVVLTYDYVFFTEFKNNTETITSNNQYETSRGQQYDTACIKGDNLFPAYTRHALHGKEKELSDKL